MKTSRTRQNAVKLAPLLLSPRRLGRFLRDREAPWGPKLLVLLSLIYLLVPTDLVPDLIPVVGWLDDAGLVSAALAWLWASLRRHERSRAGSAAVELEADPAGGLEAPAKAAARERDAKAASDPTLTAE